MYIVVKYAAEVWSHYYSEDPKVHGVDVSASTHESYVGKMCGILPSYATAESAQEAADRANARNPIGYYGTCKVNTPVVPD